MTVKSIQIGLYSCKFYITLSRWSNNTSGYYGYLYGIVAQFSSTYIRVYKVSDIRYIWEVYWPGFGSISFFMKQAST